MLEYPLHRKSSPVNVSILVEQTFDGGDGGIILQCGKVFCLVFVCAKLRGVAGKMLSSAHR